MLCYAGGMAAEDPIDRQAFVQAGLTSLGKGLGGFLGALLGLESQAPPGPGAFLRPPGALAEAAFLRACTRCDACAAACPSYSIRIAGHDAEVPAGTPYMHDLVGAPCLLCPDTPCIAACAAGALAPRSPGAIRLGVAEVSADRCEAHRGTPCRACVDACPIGEEGIVLSEGRPLVVPLGCTGCGQCLSACPVEPRAIAVRPGVTNRESTDQTIRAMLK